MAYQNRKQHSRNTSRQVSTTQCAFTGTRELISQMVRSDKLGDDGPLYFSSSNALAMYKHQLGICPLITSSPEDAHILYMDTLKKCYPKLYRHQFGDEKDFNSNYNKWNDEIDEDDESLDM